MVMLGLCTIAPDPGGTGPRLAGIPSRPLECRRLTALLLVSLGAGVVSTDAMHACGEQWPGCNDGVATGGSLAVLQVVHRTTAYVVAGLAFLLLVLGASRAWPTAYRVAPGRRLPCPDRVRDRLVLSAHGSLQHETFRVLHVAGAAALWVSVVTQSRSSSRRPHRSGEVSPALSIPHARLWRAAAGHP